MPKRKQFTSFNPRKYDKHYAKNNPNHYRGEKRFKGHMHKEICATCGKTLGNHYALYTAKDGITIATCNNSKK